MTGCASRILKRYSKWYQKYKNTYPKKYLKCKKYKKMLKMPKSILKNILSPCIYLDTAWKVSSIYSITGWLKFWPQKYHSFSFYDCNKYKPLTNDNPKQYLESWIYDPNKYQKMWKHNPYLWHIPIYLYIGGSEPPPPTPPRFHCKVFSYSVHWLMPV